MRPARPKASCCDACRRLHYRCDLQEPQCGRCKSSGRRCLRTRKNLRFKQVICGSNFPLSQQWIKLPAQALYFVDETEEIIHEKRLEFEEAPPEPTQPLPPSGASLPQDSPSPSSLLPFISNAADNLDDDNHRALCAGCQFLNRSSWPLTGATEILLFQHFINKLSCFFDFCDRERHFAIEVPQRARTCPTLRNAILALSARHLSRVTNHFEPFVADLYYQECLKSLILELDKSEATFDDSLLAATVILRLLEELDVPLAGVDMHQHSVGTRALLRSQHDQSPSTSLRTAASWAGVRQEIYISLSLQRAPAIKADVHLLRALQYNDDCTWASRAVGHCSDVLEFCFSLDGGTVAGYDSLLADNRLWHAEAPPSYDPFWVHSPGDVEEARFCDIQLHTNWHVMGWQYITLARTLLIAHDPRIPRVGLDRSSALSNINDQVQAAVKLLCGIGMSNPSTPPAMLIACMGIKICGDRFANPREQQALLHVLSQTEELHGWPTKDLQSTLQDIWKENK